MSHLPSTVATLVNSPDALKVRSRHHVQVRVRLCQPPQVNQAREPQYQHCPISRAQPQSQVLSRRASLGNRLTLADFGDQQCYDITRLVSSCLCLVILLLRVASCHSAVLWKGACNNYLRMSRVLAKTPVRSYDLHHRLRKNKQGSATEQNRHAQIHCITQVYNHHPIPLISGHFRALATSCLSRRSSFATTTLPLTMHFSLFSVFLGLGFFSSQALAYGLCCKAGGTDCSPLAACYVSRTKPSFKLEFVC